MGNERDWPPDLKTVTHPLRRLLILEIWAEQTREFSSRRIESKLKSARIYTGEVSGERSCSQDCNGEAIFLIRQRVRELSRKYRKWPKMESNPLVFFRFSTFFKFSKLRWQMKGAIKCKIFKLTKNLSILKKKINRAKWQHWPYNWGVSWVTHFRHRKMNRTAFTCIQIRKTQLFTSE